VTDRLRARAATRWALGHWKGGTHSSLVPELAIGSPTERMTSLERAEGTGDQGHAARMEEKLKTTQARQGDGRHSSRCRP